MQSIASEVIWVTVGANEKAIACQDINSNTETHAKACGWERLNMQ